MAIVPRNLIQMNSRHSDVKSLMGALNAFVTKNGFHTSQHHAVLTQRMAGLTQWVVALTQPYVALTWRLAGLTRCLAGLTQRMVGLTRWEVVLTRPTVALTQQLAGLTRHLAAITQNDSLSTQYNFCTIASCSLKTAHCRENQRKCSKKQMFTRMPKAAKSARLRFMLPSTIRAPDVELPLIAIQ